MFTIGFFATSGVVEKMKQLDSYKSSLDFLNIALSLADLVYELQKERGMSAGYVGSSTKLFKLDLYEQRKLTNIAKQNFHHLLQTSNFKPEHWGLSNEFKQLDIMLDRLPAVRSAVNSLKSIDIVKFYSDINSQSISIIQVFHVLTNNIELAKQGNAYSALLWIQERSGRERAILNSVFIQGKLNANVFRQISADIEGQEILFNNYYNVVSQGYHLLLKNKMSSPIILEVDKLRDAAINKMIRNELLSQILILTGYNGLIHDFKNYVIRGEQVYFDRFNSNLKKVKDIIKQYSTLPGMTKLDLKSLDIIDSTLDSYYFMAQKIAAFIAAGVSVAEIDSQVKVNDKPAQKAIEYLQSGLSKQDARIWWQAATNRIDLIKEVSDKLRNDILSRTRERVESSEVELNQYIFLVLCTFLITLILGWFLIKRLVGELGNISKSLKKMTDEKLFNQPLEIAGHDEIGVLAQFYNQLIFERNQSEQKILHQAHFDSLTNLPNRFLSLDRLAHLITEAKRNNDLIALIFVDLDDFKKVNDSLGHETGDKLLISVSKRLEGLVREQDTAGRLGGDEFILILGGLHELDDAQSIAENIINNFRIPFIIDGRDIVLTLSLGISVFPNDGDTASELLRKSDSAMYRSKEDGRNAYNFFTEEMNKNITRRLHLEEQLHGALERGEFTVFYQPKIDLNTNEIMGAEALLRWNNPSLGDVSPNEFIPLTEQMGLITALGEFVLDQSLSMTEKIQNQFNKEFCMAVNISPRQFRERNLFTFIQNVLDKYNISGSYLELEITEGLLMGGDDYINKALFSISDKGIGIAMDDFGTGYSSLSYLRDYPFSVLKIDRSFVNDITSDTNDKELVNAAIAMAHGLMLKVVAEGIETNEQLNLIKEMGCDIGQGYLFSKPLSEDEFFNLFS